MCVFLYMHCGGDGRQRRDTPPCKRVTPKVDYISQSFIMQHHARMFPLSLLKVLCVLCIRGPAVGGMTAGGWRALRIRRMQHRKRACSVCVFMGSCGQQPNNAYLYVSFGRHTKALFHSNRVLSKCAQCIYNLYAQTMR